MYNIYTAILIYKMNKIFIQVISDIHLEFYNTFPKISPLAKYLCLAGDIGTIVNKYDTKLEKFLSYCSTNWDKVFYVLGNHEFYQKSEFVDKKMNFEELEEKYASICSKFTNVYLLSNSFVEIVPGLNIYGTTLWTGNYGFPKYLNPSDMLNDYNMIAIKSPNATKTNILIQTDFIDNKSQLELAELKNYLQNQNQNKTLIMTHFPPIRQDSSNPKYSSQPEFIANYFSWNNIHSNLNMSNVIGWISGHTHWSYDLNVSRTKFISNQMGYKSECTSGESGFDPTKIFEFEY